MNRRHWPALALTVGVAWPLSSLAQTPGQLGPPPGQTIGEEEPKKKGVAEKAPREQAKLPTLPPLPPYPGQEKKKFELVSLDGYMRLRVDWLKNFNLGFHDTGQGIPFPEPLSCSEDAPDEVRADCGNSIGSTNMRVRLEPTINLSETVALHLQLDALDNLVLGSTAESASGSLGRRQGPVEGGQNSAWDSLRVKQAWADVKTPIGDLRFGRMPWHWGLGILNHSGGYDWIHGTTCTDCDFGDTVDRFMFGTTIPGTSIRAAVGLDWAASAPTAGQIDIWRTRVDGQPFDLEDRDDVTQYVLMLGRIDEPEVWNAALREGRTALNYGVQFYYRKQDIEASPDFGAEDAETTYVSRGASIYIPDVWARFTTGRIVLEAEAVGMFGSVNNLVDPAGEDMNLRQLGAVLRMNAYFLGDDLELGLEGGFASGDQWENDPSGVINIHHANYLPRAASDTSISAFHFNPDYHVDLILFRELLGAVINAFYVKPMVRYNITDRFSFRAQAVMSFAHRPVATPGNNTIYGIELDGDVGYSNERDGFFAGLSYGVLFPLGALDHPIEIFPGETRTSAATAQTFQARFVLKF